MEEGFILRTASCWIAWQEAIDRLQARGMAEEDAKDYLEQAYLDLTRIPAAEYSRVTSQITREGLAGGTVRLHVDDWNDGDALLMVVWTPPAGFTHLLSEIGRRERRDLISY